MENEFIKKLDKDEKILVHKFANVDKTSKQYGRLLLGFIAILLFGILTVLGTKSSRVFSPFDFRIFIAFVVLVILAGCLFYGFLYNTFLKYKNKNNEYFVTNKRIALYNPKYGFRMENISDISEIGIFRVKNNYGDISFNFYSGTNFSVKPISEMVFEGVENPNDLATIICNINKTISVYNDRDHIMKKKF